MIKITLKHKVLDITFSFVLLGGQTPTEKLQSYNKEIMRIENETGCVAEDFYITSK